MLLIAFKSGATYAYEAVPKSVAAAFGNALSKGKFFRAEIRNSFTASKLGESGVVDLLHRPDEPRAVTRCKKSKVSLASLVLRHPILDAVF